MSHAAGENKPTPTTTGNKTGTLTFFIGSVFYIVGSISKVSDERVGTAARWVADEGFDVVTSGLCECTSIHSEICGGFTENA